MAASMVMTLPSILVFILLQRYYIQGVVISSAANRRASNPTPGPLPDESRRGAKCKRIKCILRGQRQCRACVYITLAS